MLTDPEVHKVGTSGHRKYWMVSATVFAIVISYVSWVFWSRAHQNRLVEQRAAAKDRASAAETFEEMGGNRLEILAFYASPGVIRRGDSAELCYGVSNAKAVTLEPQASPVWPSYSRCVKISPEKTTAYTLTITDPAGHTKSANVTVQVR